MRDYKKSIKPNANQSKGLEVKTGNTYRPKYWRFSLALWREIDNFQLGSVKASWFISLLQQLQTLCGEKLDSILTDPVYKGKIRYHPIDWNAKNIPIKKTDINWVGNSLESQDVEICQFQISQGNGRIIGFFDHESVFNILLFDPNHNAQPSNYSDYKIRPTSPASSQLDEAIREIRNTIKGLDIDVAVTEKLLAKLHEDPCNLHHPSILVSLSDDQIEEIHKYLADGTIEAPGDLLCLGLGELAKL